MWKCITQGPLGFILDYCVCVHPRSHFGSRAVFAFTPILIESSLSGLRMIAPASRSRLRVYALGGEELDMLDTSYAIPRPFKYVSLSTRIKDVFSACCETLQWPREFMILRMGGNTYKWPRLLSEQQHLHILVTTLIPSSGSQQLSDVSYDFTCLRRVPHNFQSPDSQGYCLCNFGGCCRLCFVPSSEVCWGCGNNGCCRSVNCGCSCCESPKGIHPERRCPISGCIPWWADEGVIPVERPAGFTL